MLRHEHIYTSLTDSADALRACVRFLQQRDPLTSSAVYLSANREAGGGVGEALGSDVEVFTTTLTALDGWEGFRSFSGVRWRSKGLLERRSLVALEMGC